MPAAVLFAVAAGHLAAAAVAAAAAANAAAPARAWALGILMRVRRLPSCRCRSGAAAQPPAGHPNGGGCGLASGSSSPARLQPQRRCSLHMVGMTVIVRLCLVPAMCTLEAMLPDMLPVRALLGRALWGRRLCSNLQCSPSTQCTCLVDLVVVRPAAATAAVVDRCAWRRRGRLPERLQDERHARHRLAQTLQMSWLIGTRLISTSGTDLRRHPSTTSTQGDAVVRTPISMILAERC